MIKGVTPGTYRHKKGGRYLVFHNAVTVTRDTLSPLVRSTLNAAFHSDDKHLVLVVVDRRNGQIYVLDTCPEGTPVVVYYSLDYGTWWVRPEHEWHDLVDWDDGVKRKRFTREDF